MALWLKSLNDIIPLTSLPTLNGECVSRREGYLLFLPAYHHSRQEIFRCTGGEP